jgi:hypothetical protein
VGYDIRSGFVTVLEYTDRVISGACYGHVFGTWAGSQRRARDGYYDCRLPEVRRPPCYIDTVFEFWFWRQKIGVTHFACDSNDNQRSPKTQSALPLDYGDSCTVVVVIEQQFIPLQQSRAMVQDCFLRYQNLVSISEHRHTQPQYVTQPLDIAYLSPLKTAITSEVDAISSENR